jgi:hypothetical protein
MVIAAGFTTAQAQAGSGTGNVALGQQCSSSTDCANGADCYATNYMLITTCGNFQASCTSDSQCAYNTCNNGLCNGFLPSESYLASIATVTSSTPAAAGTGSMVYLPLGSSCNPSSTPCANGAECWASNSMLQMRCGNFNAACTSDEQCAYNICNTETGLCSGFKPTGSMTTVPMTTTTANSCRKH